MPDRRKEKMNPSSAVISAAREVSSVFVYGSLLADDVVKALLNRIPESSAAILNGYHRFSIRGRVYPAILPVPSKKVTGKVLFGLTHPELHILDLFEDDEYERTAVEVSLMDGSGKLRTHAYVWGNKSDPNLFGEWDFEEWKRIHLIDFAKMTTGFMEELELPQSKTRVAKYESFFQQDANNSPGC